MLAQRLPYLSLLFITCTAFALERSQVPDNGKFSIGRETITSYGYASYVTGLPCFVGNNYSILFYFNNLSYGLTPTLGCTFSVPFILHQREYHATDRGLWDIRANIQWHAYRSDDQMLVFKAGMWFPTGDVTAIIPLSSGSFNPTLYAIAVHSSERLFANFVIGGVITTPRKHRRPGGLLDYHLGIGPKFPIKMAHNGKLYVFLELQGYHNFSSDYYDQPLPNSGWHLLTVGPTISYDTDFFQIQGAIGLPIIDRRFGIQPSTDFFASLWYGVRF